MKNKFEERINIVVFKEMNRILERLACMESDVSFFAGAPLADYNENYITEIEKHCKETIHLAQDAIYSLWLKSDYSKDFVKPDDKPYFCDDLYS